MTAKDERESLERLRKQSAIRPGPATAWLEEKVEEHRLALRELRREVEIDPQLENHLIREIRWRESMIYRIDRVLDERIASEREHRHRPVERPAKPLVLLPPLEIAASTEEVQQETPAIHTIAGRTTALKTYKAHCKREGGKEIRYEEIGLAIEPCSKGLGPRTIVNKWRACDPKYEKYTPRFLEMFAQKPHLRKPRLPRAGG